MSRITVLGIFAVLLFVTGATAVYWYTKQSLDGADLSEAAGANSTEQSSSTETVREKLEAARQNERYPDTKRENLPLREVRSWTHSSGVTVRLYEKDRFTKSDEYGIETAMQQILKAQTKDGKELVLLDDEPWNVYLGQEHIEEVRFSPLGTYVVVTGVGYEAPFAATYNLQTGVEEFRESEYSFAVPYWSADEMRLALVRPSVSIDGTVAAIFYSATGKPENLIFVKDFRGGASAAGRTDPHLERVAQDGNFLTLWLQISRVNWGDERDLDETYTFDLSTGDLIKK